MKKLIAVLPGDGIGPEVSRAGVAVLEKVASIFGHEFTFSQAAVGAAAIDQTGEPYPEATRKICHGSDAILFGAIGDPRYDNDPSAKVRPEQGLLAMRKDLELYANVRPVSVFKSLAGQSPLRPELVEGIDFVVVRELIGGIYFGKRGRSRNGKLAYDTCEYNTEEIIRIAKFAFELSERRGKKITVVDKANVLETSRLWRETIKEREAQYPQVAVDYMFVDNAAMQLIRNPKQFDVILTENMFGDILTDEASVLAGSLGMLPSASIGGRVALYEPIHGSYPQAAGKNTANPVGSILSAALMLDYSFGLKKESAAIFRSVESVLDQGFGTEDLSLQTTVSTTELTKKIVEAIKADQK